MDRLTELWNRLLGLFRRGEIDRDLEEEMRFHVEMQAREHVEAGMSEAEARRAAHQAFGNRGPGERGQPPRLELRPARDATSGRSLRGPHPVAEPRLHRRHRPHPRPWDRRQHRHLHAPGHGRVAPAARGAPRRSSTSSARARARAPWSPTASRNGTRASSRTRSSRTSASTATSSAIWPPSPATPSGRYLSPGDASGGSEPRGRRGPPRQRELLRDPGGSGDPGANDRSRGQPGARRAPGGGAEPRLLGTPFRLEPGRRSVAPCG